MSFSCSSADDQSRPELLTVVNVLNICYKIWIIIILSVKCGVSLLFLSSSCMFPCSVCGWVGDLCWPLHQSYVTGPYTVPQWQYCTVKSLIGCHSNHSSVASYVLTDENPVKLVSHQSFCGLCLNFLQEVKMSALLLRPSNNVSLSFSPLFFFIAPITYFHCPSTSAPLYLTALLL